MDLTAQRTALSPIGFADKGKARPAARRRISGWDILDHQDGKRIALIIRDGIDHEKIAVADATIVDAFNSRLIVRTMKSERAQRKASDVSEPVNSKGTHP